MWELVAVVCAIGLAALCMLAGVGYVHPDGFLRTRTTMVANAGFDALAGAATAYRIANGVLPSVPVDGTAPTALSPAYVELPSVPSGFSWSIGSPAPGQLWICLSSPSATWAQWMGLTNSVTSRSPGTSAVASACGATASDPVPDTFPTPTAMTYFLFQ